MILESFYRIEVMEKNNFRQQNLSVKSSIKADDYESVVQQIQKARAEAVDMRRKLDQINIDDDPDPKKRAQYQSFLDKMADAVNRWRGVVQGPDHKPGFWERILHPFGGGQNMRDQIVSIDKDKRRLRLANVRDDFDLLKQQTEIMKDITDDIMVDPEYDLKSYSVKSTQTLKEKLDIIIKGFDKALSDIADATKKDITTSGAKMNYVDKSEKAAVDAAIRYYRAMTATLDDVVDVKKSIPSKKSNAMKWPFGGGGDDSGDVDQEVLNQTGISNEDIEEIAPDAQSAADVTGYIEEADPNGLENLGNKLDEVGQASDQWSEQYNPNMSNPEPLLNQADRILAEAQGTLSLAEQLHQNGTLDDQTFAQIAQNMEALQQQYGDVTDDDSGAFYDEAAASYSKSVLQAMRNMSYPITIKGAKVKPAEVKNKLKKSSSAVTSLGQKLKKKASKLRTVKPKVIQTKKKILSSKKK